MYVANLLDNVSDLKVENVLEFFTKQWKNYNSKYNIFNNVCKTFVKLKFDHYELNNFALMTWRDNLKP